VTRTGRQHDPAAAARLGAGPMPAAWRISHTVEAAIGCPTVAVFPAEGHERCLVRGPAVLVRMCSSTVVRSVSMEVHRWGNPDCGMSGGWPSRRSGRWWRHRATGCCECGRPGADGAEVAAVTEFLLDLRACGGSAGSARSYALALLRWLRFLEAVGVAWERAAGTRRGTSCCGWRRPGSPSNSGRRAHRHLGRLTR
jgi:hypothetical protein